MVSAQFRESEELTPRKYCFLALRLLPKRQLRFPSGGIRLHQTKKAIVLAMFRGLLDMPTFRPPLRVLSTQCLQDDIHVTVPLTTCLQYAMSISIESEVFARIVAM